MICNWKGCTKKAVNVQTAKDGENWSKLCQEHTDELWKSLKSGDPIKTLRSWILAQGGAEFAAKRIGGKR